MRAHACMGQIRVLDVTWPRVVGVFHWPAQNYRGVLQRIFRARAGERHAAACV